MMKHCLYRLLGALALLAVSPALLAIGLGELRVQSGNGQPLLAATEVFSPHPHTAYDMSARLLPLPLADAATRNILTGIDAEVMNQGSRVVIVLRGDRPLNLPLLQFRLALTTPEQRLIREYDVLFDLPSSASDSSIRTPVTTAPQQPVRPASLSGDRVSYGPVVSGDSLWKLAKRVARERNEDSYSVMQQLHAENPHAFIDGNIDRLKTGVTLSLPATVAPTGFEQEVVEEPAVAPPQAVVTAPAVPAPAAPEPVAEQPAVQSAEAVSPKLAQALQQQQELKSRYQELQARIDELNRRLAGEQASPVPADTGVSKPLAVVEQERTAPATAGEPAADAEPIETAGSAVESEPEVSVSPEVAAAGEVQSQASPEPVPVVVPPQPQQQSGWLDMLAPVTAALSGLSALLFSWQVMAAIIALAVVVIAAVVVSRILRQRRNRIDQHYADERLRAAVSEKADRQQERENEYRQAVQQTLARDAIRTDDDDGLEISLEEDDELDELLQIADTQIAYEEFDEAEATLVKGIEQRPDDGYLRFRLLQVYDMTDNRTGFMRQARQLADRKAVIDVAIWQEVMQLGAAKYPQETLFAPAAAESRSEVIRFDSFANRSREDSSRGQHDEDGSDKV